MTAASVAESRSHRRRPSGERPAISVDRLQTRSPAGTRSRLHRTHGHHRVRCPPGSSRRWSLPIVRCAIASAPAEQAGSGPPVAGPRRHRAGDGTSGERADYHRPRGAHGPVQGPTTTTGGRRHRVRADRDPEPLRRARLAGAVPPPATVDRCLAGELGAGKTTFAQGFARGLGITDRITSPTFTLVREYAGRLALHHLDVYRLEQLERGRSTSGSPRCSTRRRSMLIEWGDAIAARAARPTTSRCASRSATATTTAASSSRPSGGRWPARPRALAEAVLARGHAGRRRGAAPC